MHRAGESPPNHPQDAQLPTEELPRPTPPLSLWSSADDAALLVACQTGDASAWEQLLSRYQRLVYSVPRRAGLSDEQAAEVFQHVWLTLLEHIDRIRHPERLASWLVTTARREGWRLARSERGDAVRAVGSQPAEGLDEVIDPDLLPDEVLERLERQHLVRASMASLEPRCRDLLTLLFFQEESPPYAVVAASLGLAEGSIGPSRARCLRHLRRLIEADERWAPPA